MKKFIILLIKGIAVAITLALGICYFLWSTHTAQRMFWCVVVYALAIPSCCYLMNTKWVKNNDDKGAAWLKMTKLEQIGKLLKAFYFPIAVFSVILWLIGYAVNSLFGIEVSFWEMYLVYGLTYTVATIVVIAMLIFLSLAIYGSLTSTKIRTTALPKLKSALLWFIVIICSLASAIAILYFLIPQVV